MFRILVDTCVWLDLAGDPRKLSVLGVVEELQRRGMIQLLVPKIVLDEFTRNRARIAKNSEKSLGSHFREVRDAIERAGGNRRKQRTLLASLQDVAHRVPLIGGQANQTMDRIESLLKSGVVLDVSDGAKLRAAQRALEKRAPFHKGKNSMADALLIETFGECARDSKSAGIRFAFVTLNKEDFGPEHGSLKLPHPDIAHYFSKVKALYFISLAEALRRVEPDMVTDIMIENSWTMEPRALSEMLDAEELLLNQIWYNRHLVRREKVEAGKIKVVDVEKYPVSYPERTVQRDIWKGALQSARKVEKRFGKENLGPWTDFEWGMLNGKLSALRWVLGDEWDMLDT